MSTKIHALVDALGNPTGFFLTGGEAHDLVGADRLLPSMEADIPTGAVVRVPEGDPLPAAPRSFTWRRVWPELD